jgi:glycerophosphoryl diester phosphodiesterase
MIIVGHRGAKAEAPENTLAGLQAALDDRVDEIEIDARVTKDTVVVLSHDPHILSDKGTATIAEKTYKELLELKPDLTTLESAIQKINRAVPIYLEVKPKEPVGPIVDVVKSFLKKGWQPGDFLFASFSYKILVALHNALPDVELIINEHWSGVRASSRARRLGAKRISMGQRWLWPGFISSVRRGGYQLGAYPLNDTAKAERWAKHGLYAVITDNPSKFKKS